MANPNTNVQFVTPLEKTASKDVQSRHAAKALIILKKRKQVRYRLLEWSKCLQDAEIVRSVPVAADSILDRWLPLETEIRELRKEAAERELVSLFLKNFNRAHRLLDTKAPLRNSLGAGQNT